MRDHVGRLWVIEQHPSAGGYPAESTPGLIPQADVVAVSSSNLINHTLEALLDSCSSGAEVMVLGPSTPLSPMLFDYGAAILAGSEVVDEAVVLRRVGQGASFRQVRCARLLTLTKPD